LILVGLAVGPSAWAKLVYEHPGWANVTITDPEGLEPSPNSDHPAAVPIGLELSFNRLWQMRNWYSASGALDWLVISLLLASFLAMMVQYWTGALGLGLRRARTLVYCAGAADRRDSYPGRRAGVGMLL